MDITSALIAIGCIAVWPFATALVIGALLFICGHTGAHNYK